MTVIVSLKNLSFSYHDTPVLTDVTLDISQGEFIGIFGPNGGGKSTLLKLIMGFLTPDSGAVELFGLPPHEARQQIAYVPQNLRFDKEFPISVLEVVLGGRLSHLPWYGRYHPEDKTEAIEALKLVGMEDFNDRAFGTLSGGQAQRVLIARALVSKPKLLLLDEPTAGVDAKAEASIYELLKRLKQRMTILMVTHDLRVTISMVERVLCVQKKIVPLLPNEVCEHFAIGLYHVPLVKMPETEDRK